jgi:hypothetical protein
MDDHIALTRDARSAAGALRSATPEPGIGRAVAMASICRLADFSRLIAGAEPAATLWHS